MPNLIDIALNIANEYMKDNDVSHDMAHIYRVVNNARKIHSQSSVDIRNEVELDTLLVISALHDCLDKKYIPSNDLPAYRKALKGKLVCELNFSADKADFILNTIENISWSAESVTGSEAATSNCKYLAIARDADRLDAIGAVGIARCFAFSAAKNRPLMSEDFAAETRAQKGENTDNESALVHFYEKLLKLKDRFKTEPGRQMALQRHEFLLAFLDQAHAEMA